jgi:hypothetical protein
MLYSGKKILTLVLSEKKFLNETKNHNPPPFKLNSRSLTGRGTEGNEQWGFFVTCFEASTNMSYLSCYVKQFMILSK